MNLVEIIRSHPAIVPVVLVGIVALVVRFVKQKKLMELVRKIPGPPRYPLVGSLFELLVPREGKPNERETKWTACRFSKLAIFCCF